MFVHTPSSTPNNHTRLVLATMMYPCRLRQFAFPQAFTHHNPHLVFIQSITSPQEASQDLSRAIESDTFRALEILAAKNKILAAKNETLAAKILHSLLMLISFASITLPMHTSAHVPTISEHGQKASIGNVTTSVYFLHTPICFFLMATNDFASTKSDAILKNKAPHKKIRHFIPSFANLL